MKKIKAYKKSLVLKLTVCSAAVVIILFAALISSNFYSLHVVKTNIVNSAMNEMRIHIRDMNNSLNNSLKDLNEVALNINDITYLTDSNESVRYFASMRLSEALSERIALSRTTDLLAIYNSESNIFLMSNSSRVTAKEKLSAEDTIRASLISKKTSIDDLWSTVKINEKMFFYKAYHFSDTIIAAFVKADTLISYANIRDFNVEEQIVLTDKEGRPLAEIGSASFKDIEYPLKNSSEVVDDFEDKYLMITAELETSHARLSTIMEEKSVLLGLGYIQWVIVSLGIISLFLMPYIIYYLNKEIIKPIKALLMGLREVEQGNLDYRLKGISSSLEFESLNNSFNSMTTEIKSLKISAYEEKLELQKAELKYLQMQIRPHFFLNALTTVHSLTYKNKNEDIRKFIDALSNHLRYMFRGGLNMVKINEEIEYVKNYFCMQEIKFPDSIFYIFDVDPIIEGELIPQFIVHTFVENSFKHAMTLEEPLSIFIKVKQYVFDDLASIKIIIEDNGEGFPVEVIDKVNNNYSNHISDGYKIGIFNVKRTLALLYGKDNLLKLSNCEGLGGRVEIIIPLEKGELNETNNS